jgi:isoleucyl-tRNA synthetase
MSVHLENFPKIDEKSIDLELEEKMSLIEDIVWLARSLREKARIRVRQPLSRLLIPTDSIQMKREIMEFADIILEELNIKDIEFISSDNTDIIKRKAKANFKVMGKKFGKQMKTASEAVAALTSKQIIDLEKNGKIEFEWNGEHFEFVREDVEIYNEDIEGWLVATDGKITVALDTTIDDKLRQEGIAREFISKVQNLRKDQGFEVTDRIEIILNANSDLGNALFNMKDYVQRETLAINMNFDENLKDGTEIDILENKLQVIVKKI